MSPAAITIAASRWANLNSAYVIRAYQWQAREPAYCLAFLNRCQIVDAPGINVVSAKIYSLATEIQ